MQIDTNTLLLAFAAVLAIGVAYLIVAAPSWDGGAYAAGTGYPSGGGCPMMGGGAINNAGAAGGSGAGGSAGSGSGAVVGSGTGAATGPAQDVYVKALGGARFGQYDVNELRVKAGQPVRLHFTADNDAGCGRLLVIYGLGVQVTAQNGKEGVVEFTPQKAGTYDYSCGMRMFGPGKLIVS
jgi:heme/copper-type cytochrome/quinol oxidase subunit 2